MRNRILSRPKSTALAVAALVAIAVLAAYTAFASVPTSLNKALETQRRLVMERPNDAAVLNDLGNLLVLADLPLEAGEAYRQALGIDPERVSSLFNLALLEQQRGERREALRLLKKVVELQPAHAWAHYQLGTLYESWDQDNKAVEHYARAFALDPQLAFKEVNPHIVENELVTQAMIRAYGDGGVRLPQAPQTFDEPGRIARMLMPARPPAEEIESGEAVAEDTSMGAVRGQSAQQSGAAAAAPTVLRQDDLRSNPTGQAVPQAGSRMGGRGTMRPGQPTDRGLRQWERPEPGYAPQPMDPTAPRIGGGQQPGQQPGQVVTPPPGGVYYRPGSPSSGRLEIKVAPDRDRATR